MSQVRFKIPMISRANGCFVVKAPGLGHIVSGIGSKSRTVAGNRGYHLPTMNRGPSAAMQATGLELAKDVADHACMLGAGTTGSAAMAAAGRSGGKTVTAMLMCAYKSSRWLVLGLSLALSVTMAERAAAFDMNSGVTKESGPFDLFRFGFKAYKKGQKQDAVEAYRYAAEKGHTGSRWALANMYADGDGVAKNDFEAFKIYSEIATQGVEPGSDDTGFFVNALLSLAKYYHEGISGSPVKADPAQARQLYFQAASAFGIPEAQFQLAKMILAGEGGRPNVLQAKKWLNQARKSGHAGAMAVFGNLIFQEGQAARGLAFLTASLDKCNPSDCPWIEQMQEQAFSVANEEDRRVAISLAQNVGQSPD
jgi:TPR repeat protein